MPDYKEILYDKQRGGVLITLNRPEALNAITRSMLKELHQALDEAELDPEIRAIVLTGAGRGFCSGFDQATTSGRRRDMQWPQGMPTDMSTADLLNYWRKDDAKLLHIFELTKPVIGAVRGWAMGGGCWLVCSRILRSLLMMPCLHNLKCATVPTQLLCGPWWRASRTRYATV
jgi:enoyl-CoA hydratase/carnithine racemase